MRFRTTTATGTTLIVMTALAGAPLAQAPDPETSAAYALMRTRWTNLGKQVNVCWENEAEGSDHHRTIVRRAVAETWEAASALRFVGWGQCADSSRGIRIRIQDAGPHVIRLGSDLDGRSDGMVLNFTFSNWGTSCRADPDECIYKIAVHEFGHAIGFAHEQNRPDAPDWCVDERQGTNGDSLIGGWDLASVMNYCNPDWNGNGVLSPTDKRAVQELYGNNDIYEKSGNNGTVSGDTYCSNHNGGRDWGRRGLCVGQQAPDGRILDCSQTYGFTGEGGPPVLAYCTSSFGSTGGTSASSAFFLKSGNNGTVSCSVYCGGSNWGEVGTCVRQVGPTGNSMPCTAVSGLDERGVLCACKR